MEPRYRKYYSYEINERMTGFEILLCILLIFLTMSVVGGIIDKMTEDRQIPIVEVSKPVSEIIRPMNLTMGTATVKKIREAWYKVYFSVLNRDEKVFTGIVHATITENDRVTQTGLYPCSIAPGQERLITYFTNVKPTYVRLKIEDIGLGFGARFREVKR